MLDDSNLDEIGPGQSPPGEAAKQAVKRFFFLLGIGFLVAAFVSGAAEAVVNNTSEDHGWILSAHELWGEIRPDNLLMAESLVNKHIGRWLWEPVLVSLLMLPAWLLLGAPGMAMVWFCSPHRGDMEDFDEDSLLLYDRLAQSAKEEGYDDDSPVRGQIAGLEEDESIDSAGATTIHSTDEFADEWENPDYGEAGIPKKG
ncbi:MAG: hypothetical protein V3R66_04195 [Rhodospirillales bacterium]